MSAGSPSLPPRPRSVAAGIVLCAALVLTASALVFRAMAHDVAIDVRDHLVIASYYLETGLGQAYSLYYPLLALFTYLPGLGARDEALVTGAWTLLSLAVLAKYLLSVRVARVTLAREGAARRPGGEVALVLALALACFAFSLPAGTLYLGQIPPGIWHNSTTVLLLPLALGLFWASSRYLERPRVRGLVWILALVVLNVAVKPSYVFVFVVAFPLAALARHRLGAPFRGAVAAVAFAGGVLALDWVLVLRDAKPLVVEGGQLFLPADPGPGGVELAPFAVWRALSAAPALSFLASYAFPLAFLALYRKKALRLPLQRESLLASLVALALFVLVAERGFRRLHGNFLWQAVACNAILFVTTLVAWARIRDAGENDRRVAAVRPLGFLAHVAAGIHYLVRMLAANDALL